VLERAEARDGVEEPEALTIQLSCVVEADLKTVRAAGGLLRSATG
jgi:hypothetical protein